jgi:hypothetical protein
MSSDTGRRNGKKVVREVIAGVSTYEEKFAQLKETCVSVEEVQQGWYVLSHTGKYYYVTPYMLWRPEGKRGKDWYRYKNIYHLAENYLNKVYTPKEKDNGTSRNGRQPRVAAS